MEYAPESSLEHKKKEKELTFAFEIFRYHEMLNYWNLYSGIVTKYMCLWNFFKWYALRGKIKGNSKFNFKIYSKFTGNSNSKTFLVWIKLWNYLIMYFPPTYIGHLISSCKISIDCIVQNYFEVRFIPSLLSQVWVF